VANVVFEGVSKVFPDGTRAVAGLDLNIVNGEFMVLVGPSGCGKTTALRMAAGLEDISGGNVRIGDRVVNDITPKDRDIAMVFQNYALYPHLTVYDNIAFALKIKKVAKPEIKRRVAEAARILDLEPYLKRKPRALSGGPRQRVAMGRAIVRQPAAFLMDEPLSNLDAKLRVQMRAEIKKIQSSLGVTTIYVTHDQVEAMTMGDRVAVMRKGELQQVAPPQELYDRPANVFVGGFIGSPAMNMLEARIERDPTGLVAVVAGARLPVDGSRRASSDALAAFEGQDIVLGIRPEGLEDAALADGERPRLSGRVELCEALGPEMLVHFTIAARQPRTEEMRELAEDAGDEPGVAPLGSAEEGDAVLVGRFSPDTRVADGGPVEVAVDPRHLHFFDPATGRAIAD
jgi:multiple sugar transport system ATP-binding protein